MARVDGGGGDGEGGSGDGAQPDPRRWLVLAIAIVSAFIVVLDNTVLNVAIPTILEDLDTTLPSLQWVLTGYALTFATFLIIGGRLGDVYGHRRIFVIGAALFGAGSLLAASSTSVAHLILGEAVIEGLGASLLLPSTLAIIAGTFTGRERATAFAAWGATAGVGAALGPLVGGMLTTHASWRWAFIINVIIAPLAIVGALLFMAPARTGERRVRIDVPGAVLVALGVFLLVLGLSEGGRYGWWEPLADFSVGSWEIWPATAPVSIVPVLFAVALVLLAAFARLELALERTGGDPLFEFSHLVRPTYRYGLLTGVLTAMGQLGLSFVLSVFLQDALGLTAQANGLWLLPSGIGIFVGAQLGGRLVQRHGVTRVVRLGLGIDAVGIALVIAATSLDMTVWQLLPGLALYGVGIGISGAQLTNVVLSEIPASSTGAASGANTTARQVGNALGVAVIGTLLTSRTIATATDRIQGSSLPEDVRSTAIERLRDLGSSFSPPPGVGADHADTLRQAVDRSVQTGTRTALVFAGVVVGLGFLMSLRIPTDVPVSGGALPVDAMEGMLEPLVPDHQLAERGAVVEGVAASDVEGDRRHGHHRT
jgi:EmrB/QacA subfamily drug resistance transporter